MKTLMLLVTILTLSLVTIVTILTISLVTILAIFCLLLDGRTNECDGVENDVIVYKYHQDTFITYTKVGSTTYPIVYPEVNKLTYCEQNKTNVISVNEKEYEKYSVGDKYNDN